MEKSKNNIIRSDVEQIILKANLPWGSLKNKVFLFSGAGGIIASFMIETLLILNEIRGYNIKLILIARNKQKAYLRFKKYIDKNEIIIIEKDISDFSHIHNEKIDYYIHLASNADPSLFFSDPVGTLKANCLGTINLLESAKINKPEGFLYFSSGEVYGDIFIDKPIKETDYGIVDLDRTRNCYAEGKRVGEMLCNSYFNQFGIKTKIVRPAHTYGLDFDKKDTRAFSNFVDCVLNNQDIILNSDGKAKRSFLYVADAVLGYFTILLKGENGHAYNVGNDYEISILDLANTIIKASENSYLKVKFSDKIILNSSKSSNGLLDVSKLKQLGWKPVTSEFIGFSKVIKYNK
jgi:UDP-glucuronate decarboxylase